ncbi:hypothetical protein TELCIR_14987 [Teladorsagia circumcincta]|uniref:Uncharacterized protein n=1 Tax=Teladorsagia circumcincta TaxID=45464 RepID=A0A2G9TZK4_TELCI|nr:hypothetical protein TELCIR_14987 [Teladorsagia circumcincta]
MPILIQFERPTFESERQSRFQNAVLQLISDLCCPSLWSAERDLEFSDCEGCPPVDPIEESPTDGVFVEQNKKEAKGVLVEQNDATVTALELVEETDCDRQSSSTLEAVVFSLCTFVNTPDQKIAAVRQALETLSKATSTAIEEQNEPFLEVIRGCIRRVGVRPLFDRMDKLFGSEDVVACLLAIASILDSLVGEQVTVLYKILDYSPAEHSMASIIIKIDEMAEADASSKCLVKILDKFFDSLGSCSMPDEVGNNTEEIKVPVMYGKSEAVAKAYRIPVVEVVEGFREVYKRVKASSSVLVNRQKTIGTRMGTEVAKLIDANKGKEQAVRKLLRKELGIREPAPPRESPRKRPLSVQKETHDVKHKKV